MKATHDCTFILLMVLVGGTRMVIVADIHVLLFFYIENTIFDCNFEATHECVLLIFLLMVVLFYTYHKAVNFCYLVILANITACFYQCLEFW